MKNHGTACTNGQLGEIGGNIIRALPNALKTLEAQGVLSPKQVVAYSQEGRRLSCALVAMFTAMYNGNADILALLNKHYVDCSVNPYEPGGFEIAEHQKGGFLSLDVSQAQTLFFLSDDEQYYSASYLDANANVLDYALAHQELIPASCKGRVVAFPGTTYRICPGGALYVRCLVYRDWGYISGTALASRAFGAVEARVCRSQISM
ncbi:MAG: hypothetical protein WAV50_01690 [Minisyncoccia bacterium]